MTTPKERYDARQKLKKMARDPDAPSDADIQSEYFFSLLDRFVTAVEKIAERETP